MTVLITGASGFIGSWLTLRLADAGQNVTAQMRRAPSALFEQLGLCEHANVDVVVEPSMESVLTATQPETLYHLAGMSQVGEALRSPAVAMEANGRATWLLFEALRQMEVPPNTVIASTDSIYGETSGQAATEDFPTNALGPYEVSKLMADTAARSYAWVFGLPVTVARLGNVYGPHDANGARIVPSIVSAVSQGNRPVLRGGGRAVRSLLYVEDCIKALRLLAEKAGADGVQGEAFNLSGDPPMTTLQIARHTLDAFGFADVDPEIIEGAPGETSEKFSSPQKAERVLGWRPETPFEDGIKSVYSAWKEAQ